MSEQQQNELLRQIGVMLNTYQENMRKEMRQSQEQLRQEMRQNNEKVQLQIDTMKEQFADTRTEMRDRDNQRHAEIMALQKKTDEKFEKIENKLDGMSKYIQNLTITAMVGIGSISVAVFALVYSIFNKN